MFAIYIRFMTTNTRPPPVIMFIYACLALVMGITWIDFIADSLVDLLDMLGQLMNIPPAALGFSILAWGNCMGDLKANTAITRKGFGEMAITGCMAGPIFNLCIGIGYTMMYVIYTKCNDAECPGGKIPWALFLDAEPGSTKRALNGQNLVPFILVIGTIFIFGAVLANGIVNKYQLSAKFHTPTLAFYAISTLALIIYAFLNGDREGE